MAYRPRKRIDWSRINPNDFLEGECMGCFNRATHTHSTGFPCCLSCFGSDLPKMARSKVKYCKRAISRAEQTALMETQLV